MSGIVERFLTWTRKAPVAQRAEAARALARSYLISSMDRGERDQVEAAMTILLDDTAPEVRLALAEVLAVSEHAPHHIILLLAADRPAIAAVVAEHSPLILDSELVDMLDPENESLQIAIARRPFVSRALSAALAEVGTARACLILLNNGGAHLPRFSLERIIERHGAASELRLTLLQRNDLPLDIRQLLLTHLAASLRNLAVSQGWLTPERADFITRDARERATIAAAFEAPADNMPALIERLMAAGELTPAFVIRAAASGQTLFFETALAVLSGIPQTRVHALVQSGRAGSLRALLQKAGLPPNTHPAFAAALEVVRNGDVVSDAASDYRRASHLLDAILSQYEQRPDRELDQILALLRRFATEAKRAAARGYMQQVMEAA
jgi:uncharacterized protein (DUF2336 family)